MTPASADFTSFLAPVVGSTEDRGRKILFIPSKSVSYNSAANFSASNNVSECLITLPLLALKSTLVSSNSLPSFLKNSIGFSFPVSSRLKFCCIYDFINLKLARAQGLAATSTAGQISDIAETTRLLQSPNGTKSTYTDILDRLELLMTLQAQTKYTKDQGRNINSIIKAVQNKTRNLSSIDASI